MESQFNNINELERRERILIRLILKANELKRRRLSQAGNKY